MEYAPGVWAIYEPLIFMLVTYVAILGFALTLKIKGTANPAELYQEEEVDRGVSA